jgi:hypothetical protein
MPIIIPVFSIAIVLAVYWWYCSIVFGGGSVWLGLAAALTMNLIWILLARWLERASWISFYGVAWELGLVIITAAYPYLVRGMSVNWMFWLGIGLAIAAVISMYMGVE